MQTNSPHKLDTSKKFIFSPFQKQFQLPLNKTNKIPIDSHLNLSPPFYHVLTKTTQTKSKQKTYATNVSRK